MAAILGKAWEGYKFLFDELPDQRTKTWFLVAKPYEGLTVLGLYLLFVLKWGPQYMKGRKAFNLDKIMIVYNIMQVVTCIYIFYYSIILAWGWDYKWICEPVDHSTNERAMDIAKTSYLYYLTKIADLFDTVFFVLRKKNNQVSFLHIYHHTGMVMLIWGAITYLPGGHATLVGVINTFVHIIMYSYYLYTVVNPSAKQSLWWKKYITQLQILQFFLCVVHMLTIVFKPDCEYPRWVSAVFLPQNFFILVLFIDFYIKNYIRKPQAQQIADLQNKAKQQNSHGLSNSISTEIATKNNNSELKILALALNNLKNDNHDTQNRIATGIESSQNGSLPQNDTSPGNSTHNSQNVTNRSRSVSKIGNCFHIDEDGKHGKSE